MTEDDYFELRNEYLIGNLNGIIRGDAMARGVYRPYSFMEAVKTYDFYWDIGITNLFDCVLGVYRTALIGSNSKEDVLEKNIGEKIHPELVQVGYDPNILDYEKIFASIGYNHAERIKIAPFWDIVDRSENLDRYEEISREELKIQRNGGVLCRKIKEEAYYLLVEMIETDGITETEYCFLPKID